MAEFDDSSQKLQKPKWWQFGKMKIYREQLAMEDFDSEIETSENDEDLSLENNPTPLNRNIIEDNKQQEEEIDLDLQEIDISKLNTEILKDKITTNQTEIIIPKVSVEIKAPVKDEIVETKKNEEKLEIKQAEELKILPQNEKPIPETPKNDEIQQQKTDVKYVDFKKSSPNFIAQNVKTEDEPVIKQVPEFTEFNEHDLPKTQEVKPPQEEQKQENALNLNDMRAVFGDVAYVGSIEVPIFNNSSQNKEEKSENIKEKQETQAQTIVNKTPQKSNEEPALNATQTDETKKHFKLHEIDIKEYLLYHKKYGVIFGSFLFVFTILLYLNFVGINVSSQINFGSKLVKLESADNVKIKYGFGKNITINNAKMVISPQDGVQIEINADIQIDAGLFSAFTTTLSSASVHFKNGQIKIVKSPNSPSAQNIIVNLIESQNSSSSLFSQLTLSEMQFVVENDDKITDEFKILDLFLKKMPDVTLAKGVVKINEHNLNIDYEYYDKTHINNTEKDQNFLFSIKSPIFEFTANGNRELYGTVSKSSSVRGEIEFSVRSVSQLISIFEKSKSITQYFINFPQITGKSKFEYSSTGDLLKIYDGKASILDSSATFSLETTNASKEYKLSVNFDSLKLDDFANHIKMISKTLNAIKNENSKTNDTTSQENEHINFFSLIGSGKNLVIEAKAKELIMQKATYFQDFNANILISGYDIVFKEIGMQTSNGLLIETHGVFKNVNDSKRIGAFSFAMSGSADAYDIAKNTIEFITLIPFAKNFSEEEKINFSFDVYLKNPSVILHDINLEIKDVMQVGGNLQYTKITTEKTPKLHKLHDITYSNLDLSRLKLELLNVKQGSTVFQEIINNNNVISEIVYSFKNVQLGLNKIEDSQISILLQDNNVQIGFDINSSQYKGFGSIIVDIRKQQPLLFSQIIFENILNFEIFQQNFKSIFAKNYVFLPSLAKFNGGMNFFAYNSQIFGEEISDISIIGTLNNGILSFGDTIFSGKSNELKETMSGKLSGKIDFSYNVPIFNIQFSFLNIATKEFQKIFPIKREFEGTISGGGAVTFSGLAYAEFLSSLKMKAKFILQKTKLPRLGLDFLAKNLLEFHGNKLFEFDKSFIETNIETTKDTQYNIIFSIVGEKKAFTIDSCNLKTAYVAGVCAGVLNILDGNQISAEIISKYVVPALDINKELKEIMKLNVSNKVKYNSGGEDQTFITDLSQVYQYINYRRATFGG